MQVIEPGCCECEVRRRLEPFLKPQGKQLPPMSARETDFLISQYEEHTEHGRHCETERSTVTTFVLAAQAAVFAWLGTDKFNCKHWPIAMLIPALAAYGYYMCGILYARFRRHNLFAYAFRYCLEQRLPGAGVARAREAADLTFPKEHNLHLNWQILHAAIGLVTTLAITILMCRAFFAA